MTRYARPAWRWVSSGFHPLGRAMEKPSGEWYSLYPDGSPVPAVGEAVRLGVGVGVGVAGGSTLSSVRLPGR